MRDRRQKRGSAALSICETRTRATSPSPLYRARWGAASVVVKRRSGCVGALKKNRRESVVPLYVCAKGLKVVCGG